MEATRNSPARYLLCRPRGGLNDTLCRIALCWDYARRFQRTLVIDCQQSSLYGQFSEYFRFSSSAVPVITTLDDSLLQRLAVLSCRPVALNGKLDSYSVTFSDEVGFVLAHNGEPARFSNQFIEDFPEEVLVYDDCGGGAASLKLLPHLVLTQPLLAEVERAFTLLPPAYCAVHIRNTDYKSDYQTILHRMRKRIGQLPVLVCSDDPTVIDYAEDVFPRRVLRTPRSVQSVESTGRLHMGALSSARDRTRAAVEAIVDLVCLGNADVLFAGGVRRVWTGDTEQPTFRPTELVSGFTLLALHLCSNKNVLDAMLNRPKHTHRSATAEAAVFVDTRPIARRLFRHGVAAMRRAVRILQ